MKYFSSKVEEERCRTQINEFLTSLTGKNWGKIQSILSSDAVISWGPYTFNGREEIITWAKELLELFPILIFQEKSLEVHGTNARIEFVITFTTPSEQKGFLPCVITYSFKDNIINNLNFGLMPGILVIEKKAIEKGKSTK